MTTPVGYQLRWQLRNVMCDGSVTAYEERIDEILAFLTELEVDAIEAAYAEKRTIQQIVAEAGSVDIAAINIFEDLESRADVNMTMDLAQEIAGSTMQTLMATAPTQLQGSAIDACQYHVFRQIASRAMDRRDLRTALSAHAEISKLLQAAA